jgi:hypothetical protein
VGEGAIRSLCEEMKVTQKDKETGEERFTTFCLDYFYKKLMRDQLVEGIREFLHEKLGKKKSKATLKEISAATLFNYKIEMCFEQEDMEQLLYWCRSEKQLKFWKKLWFSYMQKVNTNLQGKGYKGCVRLPTGFYKAVEELYGLTHQEGYVPPNQREAMKGDGGEEEGGTIMEE